MTTFKGELRLSGLKEISVESAAALGKPGRKGALWLGIETLPVDVARVVAPHHPGPLMFHGIRTLPDDAAEAIGEHVGKTMLNMGLTSLSDDAARGLATNKHLHLPKKLRMSPEAADVLRAAMGDRALTAIP